MSAVAFVTPWFGRDLVGGAEQHVLEVATWLARHGHAVEVLTTCCRSSSDDWAENHLEAGASTVSAITVRRFPVAPRDAAAFDAANRELTALNGTAKPPGVRPVAASTERAFVEENIRSPALLDFVEQHHDDYQAIVFVPCASLFAVDRARERAFLQPLLRDETWAYLPAVEAAFHRARRILFVSEHEQELAARLYGPSMWRKGTVVADRYEEALGLLARPRPQPRRQSLKTIHQVLVGLDYGDAISNQAVFIKEVLHSLGYTSRIFAQDLGAPMREHGKKFEAGDLHPGDGLIYHYAIGTDLTRVAVEHVGPKALVYHNITPAHFFEPWEPDFARLLDDGRRQLPDLAAAFPTSAGDSAYNSQELRTAGFADPAVLPIFVDPARWAQRADDEWMRKLQDGRTNILFVGRIAPNKCQHHLIAAFKQYLAFDPTARLLLPGVWPKGHPYVQFLCAEAEDLGIARSVFMPWRITEAQLHACYRTAHLFWSMSEHEGFCVPLVEAMWFDVPVLAYRSTAIPETLDDAGVMFTEKRLPELAALADLMVSDESLRGKVLAAQRKRRPAFLPQSVLPAVMKLVEQLGERAAPTGPGRRSVGV